MSKVVADGSNSDSFEVLEVPDKDQEGDLKPIIPDMQFKLKENRSFDLPNESSYNISRLED